jgi:hypothetical protein
MLVGVRTRTNTRVRVLVLVGVRRVVRAVYAGVRLLRRDIATCPRRRRDALPLPARPRDLGLRFVRRGDLWCFERPQRDDPHDFNGTALIPARDDGLIFAGLTSDALHLWSLEILGQHDEDVGWKPLKVT